MEAQSIATRFGGKITVHLFNQTIKTRGGVTANDFTHVVIHEFENDSRGAFTSFASSKEKADKVAASYKKHPLRHLEVLEILDIPA